MFLWLRYGPFEGGLSFFAGVTAVVCVGNTAGQTISRSLMMTHGALIGTICSILPRWLMQWGHLPGGVGFFVANFLVLRSRRLTSLGKKFGCLCIVITILGRIAEDGLTLSWWIFASGFLRVNIEGGVTALVASLLPYPRFATRDGAIRAQYTCQSLSSAVDACVTGFIKARDETSMSKARLLCLQIRRSLETLRVELEWSRLELALLLGGCGAGGMQSADALEELLELMDQVLQGVRGMRQSMEDMHNTRAQVSFTLIIGSSLRGVSRAVRDTLEVTSRRSAMLPASILTCYHLNPVVLGVRQQPRSDGANVLGTASTKAKASATNSNSVIGKRKTDGAASTNANTNTNSRTVDGDEENAIPSPGTRRQSSFREVSATLEEAVSRLMKDFNRARKEVLYGLDEFGRPLEGSSRQDGSARPREPGSPECLETLDDCDMSPTSSTNVYRWRDDLAVNMGRSAASPAGGGPVRRQVVKASQPMESEGARWRRSGATKDGGSLASPPNHVLVMKERQRLGSSATMARGAFLFSLSELCSTLAKKRVDHTRSWRLTHSAEAARFVLSGLWTAVRPPPGLLSTVSSAPRLLAAWCRRRGVDGGDNSRRRRMSESAVMGMGVGPTRPRKGVLDKGWLSDVTTSGHFWCFKVSLALTLCAVFSLLPSLAEQFEPPVWIAVTAAFVMESQSASAVWTSMLRLLGTVLGAVYGILAIKLFPQPDDGGYSLWAHAVLLPWVAVTCFFRNSTQFSYAALVAGFTAVVMFAGSNSVLGANAEVVSLYRIVNTVVGSVVYLLVDMLLVPTRARDLVVEQVYISLDAAFQEVSKNGERMFGPVVCPRDSRAPFLWRFYRSKALLMSTCSAMMPPRPGPPTDTSHPSRGAETPRVADDKHLRHSIAGSVLPKARRPESRRSASVVPPVASAVPWGRLPADGELLLPGFSTEKPGFLDRNLDFLDGSSAMSIERQGEPSSERQAGSPPAHSAGLPRSPAGENAGVPNEGDGVEAAQGEGGEAADVGGGSELSPDGVQGSGSTQEEAVAPAGGGGREDGEAIRKMVGALALQKRYLPIAELEPQLWYNHFPGSAYQDMVAAQEELLRALTLLTKSAIAVSKDSSTKWRQELNELGSHLASLVQLLKVALEDARDVFGRGDLPHTFSFLGDGGDDDDDAGSDSVGGGGGAKEGQGMLRMLDVQADATRLNADVQSDFVMFIQRFMDRGTFPVFELESILRISTAVQAVLGVQRTLLTLGHAVATVINRESQGSRYG